MERAVTIQRMYAPWRMDYIEQPKGEERGCIFCDKPQAGDDAASYIVHRAEHCYVILNSFPYNNGHLMVVPYPHVAALEALDNKTRNEMMGLTARSIEVLREAYHPEGFNIGINQGAAAGAGIAGHLHQHIVPRWSGDTNFMPVVADTRVLPESLVASFERLSARF